MPTEESEAGPSEGLLADGRGKHRSELAIHITAGKLQEEEGREQRRGAARRGEREDRRDSRDASEHRDAGGDNRREPRDHLDKRQSGVLRADHELRGQGPVGAKLHDHRARQE